MSRLRWWRQLHNATFSHAARSKRNTRRDRHSRIANRNPQLATVNRGKLCVRPFSTLVASRRVASLRVFCFVISSQLTSSRCGCRVQGYLQQQWPPWPQLPARHLQQQQQQQHQEAVAPYQETLGGLFPLLSRRVAPAKARK